MARGFWQCGIILLTFFAIMNVIMIYFANMPAGGY